MPRTLGRPHLDVEAAGPQNLRAALEAILAPVAPGLRISDDDDLSDFHVTHHKPFPRKLLCRNMRSMERMKDFVVPGIGVDVVDVDRMKFALERTPKIHHRPSTEREI